MGDREGIAVNSLRKKVALPKNVLFLRGATKIASVFELFMAALLIGLIGEGYFLNLAWINTFLNGASLLGKIFAVFYVLYAAIILIIFAKILIVQIKGRYLYKL
jgi:hypothetical protein